MTTAWVYRRGQGQGPYEVGHYTPRGRFVVESTTDRAVKAARRCHWLNGGADPELDSYLDPEKEQRR